MINNNNKKEEEKEEELGPEGYFSYYSKTCSHNTIVLQDSGMILIHVWPVHHEAGAHWTRGRPYVLQLLLQAVACHHLASAGDPWTPATGVFGVAPATKTWGIHDNVHHTGTLSGGLHGKAWLWAIFWCLAWLCLPWAWNGLIQPLQEVCQWCQSWQPQVPTTTFNTWESGHSRPPMLMLARLPTSRGKHQASDPSFTILGSWCMRCWTYYLVPHGQQASCCAWDWRRPHTHISSCSHS